MIPSLPTLLEVLLLTSDGLSVAGNPTALREKMLEHIDSC